MGDTKRIAVKAWVNKMLRADLAGRRAQDVLILFSMIIGEAVDEGIIGSILVGDFASASPNAQSRPHAAMKSTLSPPTLCEQNLIDVRCKRGVSAGA